MFRFTIRELVLMTVVVAMGVALMVQRATVAEARREASFAAYRLERITTILSGAGYRVLSEHDTGTLGFYSTWPTPSG